MLAIFDMTFKRYAAPSLIKFIYGFWLIVAIIAVISMIVAAFKFDSYADTSSGWWTLLFSPLILIVLMSSLRILFEWILATIRTAQYTQKLLELNPGFQQLATSTPTYASPVPAPAAMPVPAPVPAPPAPPAAGNMPPAPPAPGSVPPAPPAP